MIQNFDSYGLYESPSFILCNPDKTELYSLGMIRERKYMPRFNGLGSISFVADSYVNGIRAEYYDYLEYKRLVYLEDLGYFMITNVDKDGDGVAESKEIKAESLETELVSKRISYFKGTYKFYDLLVPETTLMGAILDYLPGWSMGEIDDVILMTKYRTFDISDSTIYNFLMDDVATAYQCIFIFDTINKTIKAYTVEKATTNTDIYLSYDNLIKSISIQEKTDELVTALSVYGGGGLNINVVNPLGTPTIYNFSNFKSTEWMSEALLNAIVTWDEKREIYQVDYAELAESLLNENLDLATLESELTELESEYAALETEKAGLIAASSGLSTINAQLTAKQAEITAKQAEVTSSETDRTIITGSLINISGSLAFTNTDNFTEEQLTELSPFVIGSTYSNENIIQTDSMSASAIQIQAQYLFDQAEDILEKISQPRYEFKVESANFIFTEDFAPFISQLALGAIITIEIDNEGTISSPALLGLDLNYDSPEDFSLIFGNRLRLDDSTFALADLLNSSYDSSISAKFNSEEWSNWSNNYKDSVYSFMTSSLDTSTNNLISGSEQSILIDQSGIRIRKSIGTNTFDPHQLWMNNGIIAFSNDGFETSSLALGNITVDGQSFYGLIADTVVGNLIAGNELHISNANAITGETTFRVTGSMVSIVNGYFSLENSNSIVYIDPDFGIKIDKKLPSGLTETQMSIDTNGNLVFAGDISGASGTFSGAINASSGYIDGWEIRDNGLWDTNGNYIRSDGQIRLGVLTIDGNTGNFNGNFYANNLIDTLTWQQISSMAPWNMIPGCMEGVNMHAGSISWGGTCAEPIAILSCTPTGVATLTAPSIEIGTDGENSIYINNAEYDYIHISVNNSLVLGGTLWNQPDKNIKIMGQLWAGGEPGVTGVFPFGENQIEFKNGIATGTSVGGEGSLLGGIFTLPIPSAGDVTGTVLQIGGANTYGLVYKLNTGGGVTLASNSSVNESNCFLMGTGTDGKFLLHGIAITGSWTIGGLIYLSTGGTMTQTVPSGTNIVAQILGVAVGSNRMFFNPCLVQVEML